MCAIPGVRWTAHRLLPTHTTSSFLVFLLSSLPLNPPDHPPVLSPPSVPTPKRCHNHTQCSVFAGVTPGRLTMVVEASASLLTRCLLLHVCVCVRGVCVCACVCVWSILQSVSPPQHSPRCDESLASVPLTRLRVSNTGTAHDHNHCSLRRYRPKLSYCRRS
jgi:hypothetical protein